ncbi:unnamed protein product [Prorocentrum cordatum]|uniref:FAD-binding FR-type domain-containing protein n=1 Tax=Prorocentrum cordatum TaxID=2364126 RepID=A0ABN9T7A3_9DINO|nr:unnamed protein product [Polarella glacialis]
MITGLGIFVLLVIVMVSSFLRRHIPFEWFYVLHHFVLVLFGLTIAHTLDDQFWGGTRVGKNRSQSFRFIATTLSLYLLDRAWSFLTMRRNVPVQEAVVTSTKSMLTLVCKKPVDFQFAPGQYAYIQIPSLDLTFHPFSIGSAPEEVVLRFYIVVYKGQWTEKLADAIEEKTVSGVNIMGPFGPGLDTNNFVSVSAVGTGTGIVPMMSLMRERYRRLTLMNKELLQGIQEDPEKVVRLEHMALYEAVDHTRLIMLQYQWKLRCMRVRGTQTSMIMSKATNRAYYHYMFDIIAHVVLLLDMCQGFWTFSWKYLNEMEFNAKFQKVDAVQWKALEVMSLVCILFFLVHRVYVWANPRVFRRSFADVLDVVAVAFMLGTHFAWAGEVPSFYIAPSSMAVLFRGSFALWRIARIYAASQVLRMGDASSKGVEHDLVKNGKFRVLWIVRGGDGFAAHCLELEDMMTDLLKKFSRWQLDLLFGLDIYLTGVTPAEERKLRELIQGSAIESCARFERPDVVEWVVQRMSDVLRDTLHDRCATTGGSMIAFCGSHAVGLQVSRGVQEANMHAVVLRMAGCRMAFHEEYYGVV